MHGYLPYPRSPPPAILYLPPNRTQSSSPPTTAYTLASTRLQKPFSPNDTAAPSAEEACIPETAYDPGERGRRYLGPTPFTARTR